MRKVSTWATRIALTAAATVGAAAACYDRVPGPAGPLPPTKEAKPLGNKPKRIKPAIEVNPKFGGTAQADEQPTPAVPSPTQDVRDAGASDVIDLPPVPDATGLDAPILKK
ncbi:MAG TPA: hypothetical protein VIV40_12290 [Kofleriaceae bacterium]